MALTPPLLILRMAKIVAVPQLRNLQKLFGLRNDDHIFYKLTYASALGQACLAGAHHEPIFCKMKTTTVASKPKATTHTFSHAYVIILVSYKL